MKEGLKMASFKFDSKKFMRELEKDIKKSIQQDLSRHPEKVLNDHVGECVDACCPHCDNPKWRYFQDALSAVRHADSQTELRLNSTGNKKGVAYGYQT